MAAQLGGLRSGAARRGGSRDGSPAPEAASAQRADEVGELVARGLVVLGRRRHIKERWRFRRPRWADWQE